MVKLSVPEGERFGRLRVVKELSLTTGSRRRFKLKCDCGGEKVTYLTHLRSGIARSCGCLQRDSRSYRLITIPQGTRFNRLVILKEVGKRDNSKQRRMLVKCDCGTQKVVDLRNLKNGSVRSCGCYHKEVGSLRRTVKVNKGDVFGRLTVIEELGLNTRGHRTYKMRCGCGVIKVLDICNLKPRGNTKSCGCLKEGKRIDVEPLLGSKFGGLTLVREVSTDRGRRVEVLCDCGVSKIISLGGIYAGMVRSCGCSVESKPEKEVLSFIKTLFIGVEILGNDRGILDGKEIDIFIPSENLGIEYNGNVWHSDKFKKDKMYHFNKRLLAESKGVRLIQIRSDEWADKGNIIKSLIKAVLHQSENRYFARKLTIAEVPGKQAQKFLLENHLMGGYRSSRHLGLFTPRGQLIQLFSFKLLKDQTEMDCSRICSLRNCSVVGGVSRLLKAALRKHPSVQRVISFVDLRYADGHSLEKIGFVREKVTLGWGWTDGRNWFNRLQCKADPKRGLTERENAALKGWYRIYDAGQAKYIMET